MCFNFLKNRQNGEGGGSTAINGGTYNKWTLKNVYLGGVPPPKNCWTLQKLQWCVQMYGLPSETHARTTWEDKVQKVLPSCGCLYLLSMNGSWLDQSIYPTNICYNWHGKMCFFGQPAGWSDNNAWLWRDENCISAQPVIVLLLQGCFSSALAIRV